MKRLKLPRYVYTWIRAGKRYVRFKRGGFSRYLSAPLFTPEFDAEYAECMREVAKPIEAGKSLVVPGTVADLAAQFRKSERWAGMEPGTRKNWQRTMTRLQPFMPFAIASVKATHASQLLAKLADRPNAANRLRTHAKALWRWGIAVGMVKTNPWEATTRLKIRSSGYATWTEADVDAFANRWPVGTREYLALALMLATCARRGDAIRLGPQHIASGRLRFRTRKTGVEIDVPIRDELAAALAQHKTEHAIFLVTASSAPFTDAGFGNWFGDACKAAGVTARAHGLRKRACSMDAQGQARVRGGSGSQGRDGKRDGSSVKIAHACQMQNTLARQLNAKFQLAARCLHEAAKRRKVKVCLPLDLVNGRLLHTQGFRDLFLAALGKLAQRFQPLHLRNKFLRARLDAAAAIFGQGGHDLTAGTSHHHFSFAASAARCSSNRLSALAINVL